MVAGGLDKILFVMLRKMCVNGEVLGVAPEIGMELIVEVAGNSRRLARSKMWQKLGGTLGFEFDMSVKVLWCRGVLSGVDNAPMPISISQKRRSLSRPRLDDQLLTMYTSRKRQGQRYPTSWPRRSTAKLP